MVGCYRRFVLNYAKIALPLTELLKKDIPFEWMERQMEAFNQLKSRMVTTPMLTTPSFESEFHVTGDASGFCIGIILQVTPTQVGTKRSIVEIQPLPLQSVRPMIPMDPGQKEKLGEDFAKMKLSSPITLP